MLELLSEIRKLSPNVIVIMVTAFGCEEYAMKATELWANNYLKKPVRHNELLPLLKKFPSLTQKPTESLKQPEEVKLGTVEAPAAQATQPPRATAPEDLSTLGVDGQQQRPSVDASQSEQAQETPTDTSKDNITPAEDSFNAWYCFSRLIEDIYHVQKIDHREWTQGESNASVVTLTPYFKGFSGPSVANCAYKCLSVLYRLTHS